MDDQNIDMEPLERFATQEEYDEIWKIYVEKSPIEKSDWKILKRSITENKLDERTITMLDIGAGHGTKASWLKEMGVDLKYVYAVESNPHHCQRIKATYQALGIEHDIDERPFTDDFTLLPNRNGEKFDLVLMCHVAYYFRDELESIIAHAHRFVKPGGTLLLITEGGPSENRDLVQHILPSGHGESITSNEIVSRLRQRFPSLSHRAHKETVHVDMDDLVRGRADKYSMSAAVVSVLLQSPYDKLSAKMQKRIVDKIVSFGNVVNGKYCLECISVGDEISLKL